MRPMFISAAKFSNMFGGIILIIAIGIPNAMQTNTSFLTTIRHYVKTVEGTEQSLSHSDIDVDCFDANFILRTFSWRSDSIQLSVLVRNNQSPFRIRSHADPRPHFVSRHRVKKFDIEPFGNLHIFHGRCHRLWELNHRSARSNR
jgi:hypothetical protein